jgi:hypothetical protein
MNPNTSSTTASAGRAGRLAALTAAIDELAAQSNADAQPVAQDPSMVEGLEARLRAAIALLPPVLGGAPTQPLEVGRASRVVQPAQRIALAVRDGAGWSPTAAGRWPGGRPIICATGCMAARPTWPIWPCCAGLIIGRSMRGVGGWSAGLLAASPPLHPPGDIPAPPDRRRETPRHRHRGQPRGSGSACGAPHRSCDQSLPNAPETTQQRDPRT